jgi:WD40 repeat protein
MGALQSGPSLQHPKSMLIVAFTLNSACYAVSPYGRLIAVNIANVKGTTFQVLDSTRKKPVATIKAHSGNVTSLTFSLDSKRILASSMDKMVHVHTINY